VDSVLHEKKENEDGYREFRPEQGLSQDGRKAL
jgi:hypothetical protein